MITFRRILPFFAFLLALPLFAQKKAAVPSGPAILENVEKTTAGVQDYIAKLEAQVDMERLRVPKMTATMYYRKPDKVHFESPNFVMLPREGIALNPAVLRERYNASVVGEDTADGRNVVKVLLTGKQVKVRPNLLTLWIDPTVWTIVKMESVPYQGRVLRIAFTYAETGGYWLPATLKATFEMAERDTTMKRLDLGLQAPQLEELQRPIRNGTIFVKYLDYKINTGFSDDVFAKPENPPKGK